MTNTGTVFAPNVRQCEKFSNFVLESVKESRSHLDGDVTVKTPYFDFDLKLRHHCEKFSKNHILAPRLGIDFV